MPGPSAASLCTAGTSGSSGWRGGTTCWTWWATCTAKYVGRLAAMPARASTPCTATRYVNGWLMGGSKPCAKQAAARAAGSPQAGEVDVAGQRHGVDRMDRMGIACGSHGVDRMDVGQRHGVDRSYTFEAKAGLMAPLLLLLASARPSAHACPQQVTASHYCRSVPTRAQPNPLAPAAGPGLHAGRAAARHGGGGRPQQPLLLR